MSFPSKSQHEKSTSEAFLHWYFKNLSKFYKGVIQKVCSLSRGGGSLKSEQKRMWREGPSMCVCLLFKKKWGDFQDDVL